MEEILTKAAIMKDFVKGKWEDPFRSSYSFVFDGYKIARGYRPHEKVSDCLMWLLPHDFYQQRHKAIFSKRQRGQGGWFLQDSTLKQWISNLGTGIGGSRSERVLYLSGASGTGKTLLSSILVDYLDPMYSPGEYSTDMGREAIAVVYYNQQIQEKPGYTTANVLASIYAQLICSRHNYRMDPHPVLSEKPEQLDIMYLHDSNLSSMKSFSDSPTEQAERAASLRHCIEGNELDYLVSQLSEDIRIIALRYSRFYIVIDGLDEFKAGDRTELVAALSDLANTNSVKLLFTGTDNTDEYSASSLVNHWFPGHPKINMNTNEIDGEIRRFVRAELGGTHPVFQNGNEVILREKVVERITKLSYGQSLLAKNNLQILKRCASASAVQNALNGTPSSIMASYDCILMQIMSAQSLDDYNLSIRALMWILLSFRALSPDELIDALVCQSYIERVSGDDTLVGCFRVEDEINRPTLDDILRVCCGLVTVSSGFMEFTHSTIRQYLDQRQSKIFPNGHTRMAEVCLTYLIQDSVTPLLNGSWKWLANPHSIIRTQPLFLYAFQQWGNHGRSGTEPDIQELITQFFSRKQILNFVMQEGYSHEHSRFQGKSSTRMFQKSNITPVDINSFRSEDDALLIASCFGLVGAVRRILANPVPTSGIEWGSQGYVVGPRRQSLFGLAAENGHWSLVDLVLSLIDFSPEKVDGCGFIPLHYAAMAGKVILVERLLQWSDKTLHMVTRGNQTTLHLAAGRGHTGVVKLLLRHLQRDLEIGKAGSECFNSQDDNGGTPLLLAIAAGHDEVIDLLLNTPQVQVDLGIFHGRNPLAWACFKGKAHLVDLLLSRSAMLGTAVNEECDLGRTPLWWAASSGNTLLVKNLLRYGANVNSIASAAKRPGMRFFGSPLRLSTPMAVAARYGYWEILQVLLDQKDINPNAETIFPRSLATQHAIGPTWWAVRHGSLEGLKMLVDRGYDPSIPGGPVISHNHKYFSTALSQAVLGGHTQILRLLLSLKGIILEAACSKSRGFGANLVKAAKRGFVSIVVLLYESSRSNPELEDPDLHQRRCMLRFAVKQSNLILTKYLIAKSPESSESYGTLTPLLHIAAGNGSQEILALLLHQPGVDVNGRSGPYPLGVPPITKMGYDRAWETSMGIDDCGGKTALFAAARSGNLYALEFLLSREADVNATDLAGQTALVLAAREGKAEIVKRLLAIDGIKIEQSRPRWYALSEAADRGHVEIFRMLLARTDVNINTKVHDRSIYSFVQRGLEENLLTPLARAAKRGSVEIVRLLLARPEIDIQNHDLDDSYSPLALAAAMNHLEIVKILIARGCDPNHTNRHGKTALLCEVACWASHRDASPESPVDVLKYLLHLSSPSVLINHTDTKQGQSALFYAASLGRLQGVQLLLSRPDIDLNLKDHAHATPLHTAILCKREEIIRALIARDDLNPNAQDTVGRTPLMWAVLVSIPSIIAVLGLSPTLDLTLKDNYPSQLPSSALQIAKRKYIAHSLRSRPTLRALKSLRP